MPEKIKEGAMPEKIKEGAMPEQIARFSTYHYRGREWHTSELATAMAFEASVLAISGETCVFPAEDVLGWIAAMRAAHLEESSK